MLHVDIVNRCVGILGIVRPYKVILLSRSHKHVEAWYIPRYSKKRASLSHEIRVYISTLTRPLESVIVHEFIHAWQEEQKLKENHGKYFRQIARDMEKLLNLKDIYRESTDTNKVIKFSP